MTLTLTRTPPAVSIIELLTLDEARARIVDSAVRLVRECHTNHAPTVTAMLWGAVDLPGLDDHDRRLAADHRSALDHVDALGHLGEALDELDGIASAIGLDAGRVGPPPF